MIIYDYRCTAGHRFEAAVESMRSDNPACDCGATTSRLISRANIGGQASAGHSRDAMPNTWRGIGNGNRDAVKLWHDRMTKREKLEEKYPELAGDRRPVLAHEGAFAAAPLRAGDTLAPAVAKATFTKESA